jgi:colanic acid biosynthesis protein WcaH
MTMSSTRKSKTNSKIEPKPGEWMKIEEFCDVVRLTPLVSMDLVIRSPEDRVLVGRRVNEPAKGSLFVPGSRISKNETRAAAFKRITREELGIEVPIEQGKFIGVYDHFYPTNRYEAAGFGTHYIVLAYELRLNLETSKLPADQHGEYLWLTSEEIVSSPEVHQNTKAYFCGS